MNPTKILIVEDSKLFAEYISKVLVKEEYQTTLVNSGQEARSLLKDMVYQLVLLDLDLPDCSGIDILKWIRNIYNQTELPVIIVSSTTEEEKIIKSHQFGANDFISKPFSETTLKIKIKNLLQLSEFSAKLTENLNIQEDQNLQLHKYAKDLSMMIKDKDLFISILAHDLKNPLFALIGFSDILLKNIHNTTLENIEKKVNLINKISKQTYNLLDDLILWSKAQAGRIPFEPQKIDFYDISKEIIAEKIDQATAKKINLVIHVPEKITIMADLNMLKSILRNLISNAIKFTMPDGEIKITTTFLNRYAIISVSDNGVGISAKTQARLFVQTNPYTSKGTNGEEGTGLGLLLCKDFVENHGGKIWVESELGNGSNFKFTVPLC